MSLTSYRAAPPRVMGVWCGGGGSVRAAPPRVMGVVWWRERVALRPVSTPVSATPCSPRVGAVCARGAWWGDWIVWRLVLGRSGNDRLSRVLRHSTIGAEEFNGRVRDGIGF